MKYIIAVLLLCGYANSSVKHTLSLPSYVKACSRHEPNMNECALMNGRAAIPKLIHGDRKYRIPCLDPLKINRLRVDEGGLGLRITMNNIIFKGLSASNLDDIEVDVARRFTRYGIMVPKLEANTDYEIQGRILVLPIEGKGRGNVTLLNTYLNYTYEWDLGKNEDGKMFLIPKNSNLDFDTTRLYVKLENLFNGNKLLGDQMNIFMNENWRDLVHELGPIFSEAISETMRQIMQNIYELVDYDSAFPDISINQT